MQTSLNRRANVLIVEDDPIISVPVSRIFRSLGADAKTASGGLDAVRELSQGFFDLMILDWFMPDISGGEALKQAQHSLFIDPLLIDLWKGKCLPVVCYTSQSFAKLHIPACPHFQIVGHWQKPIGMQRLRSMAENLLSDIGRR